MSGSRPTGDLRERLCDVGRRLHDAGLNAGTAGNLSARVRGDGSSADRLLVTPRGVRKDRLRPEDLVEVGLGSPTREERARASTELPVHLACYRADPAAGAVVHAHAPALTGIGLRGLDIGERLPEVEEATGAIATVPFAPSGSDALGAAVGEAVAGGAKVVLLARHGVLAVSADPEGAFDRLELAELAASACLLALEPGMEMDLRPVIARYVRLAGGV